MLHPSRARARVPPARAGSVASTSADADALPATGASVTLQAPCVNAGTMSVCPKTLCDELEPMDHTVVIMDQAGWHKVKALRVPDTITIVFLPLYSPELNPVERLRAFPRLASARVQEQHRVYRSTSRV